ncbi:MAG TPA: hypothetical protein VNS32_19630 [Flavisolibacter sp.]|nr:hypothetical protein [Flavisolibacter sp.]
MKKFESPGFSLSEKLTKEQIDFFDRYGVLHFRKFIGTDSVQLFLSEIKRIERELLDKGMEKINGTPL